MAATAEPGRRRAGRPAGSPPNRETILIAARQQFAERGYDGATIRSIAAAAGVDPALVHHYFGSKDRLFLAALRLEVDPSAIVADVLAGGPEGLAERLVRRLLDAWESDPDGLGATLSGLIRSALTHEEAARMVREYITRTVLGRIAEALNVPQPRLRAALVGSQVVGLMLARFVIRVEPLASADRELLVACYAPTLERYLTGPLPGDEA
jgi:AcrR family transcriptional regulator